MIRIPRGMVLVLVMAGFGCAELPRDDTLDEATSDASVAVPPTDSMANSASTGSEWTLDLPAVNESGVSAVAMIVHRDDIVVAVVEADGLPEPGAYPMRLLTGACDEAGEEVLAFDPVIGLPDGTGESMTTLGAAEFPREGRYSVHIFGAGMAPLACAPITMEASPTPSP